MKSKQAEPALAPPQMLTWAPGERKCGEEFVKHLTSVYTSLNALMKIALYQEVFASNMS